MSANRYDAVAVRKWTNSHGEEQTAYTNVGVAFPFKEKDGYSLRLHAMPAPVDGEWTILLMVPKPREDQPAQRSEPQRQSYSADKTRRVAAATPAFASDFGDDIPFSPEWRG